MTVLPGALGDGRGLHESSALRIRDDARHRVPRPGGGLAGDGLLLVFASAGFSLRFAQIQRVFAPIELLRGVTAFLIAPILLFLPGAIGASEAVGMRDATWICLAIAGGGGLTAISLFIVGRGRLQTPDLDRWTGGEPAWESPPVFAHCATAQTGHSPRRRTRPSPHQQ